MNAELLNGFFFIYTMFILFACMAAGALAIAAWSVSHKHVCLSQAGFFACYFVELSFIFLNEWLSQNITFPVGEYYEITNPAFRIGISTVMLGSLWLMLLDVLDEHDRRVQAAPAVAFVVACVAVLVLMPYGKERQWVFYSLRQVFLAFMMAFAAWRFSQSKTPAYHDRLAKMRTPFIVFCLFVIAIFVEDTIVIMVLPPDLRDSSIRLYVSERNFCENFFVLYVSWFVCRQALSTLRLRASMPPAGQETDLERHIVDNLPSYGQAHNLSLREQEVLKLVLEGKDNNAIAQELVLSVGTIKTHVHNIMQKTGTSTRDGLKNNFWSS